MELSVIIVNYNGRKFLRGCLDSLFSKLEEIESEIIVVENDSHDGSAGFLRENYPNVKVVESKVNYGFGKGNNVGVQAASGEFILLINNDTVLKDSILPAITFLKSNPDVGAVGIKMLDGNGQYAQSCGNFPNFFNMLRLKKLLDMGDEFNTGNFSRDIYETDWMAGSFLLMPKKIYEKIKGFDERYFMYVEDVDLCKSLAESGYRRIFMPKMEYVHYVGFNNTKKPMLIKGYEIYIAKHHRGFQKLSMSLALGLNKQVKKVKSALKLD